LFHAGNVARLHRKPAALSFVRASATGHAEARGWDSCCAQYIGIGGAAGSSAGLMFLAFDELPRPDARLNDPVIGIGETARDAESHFPLDGQLGIDLDDPLDSFTKLALRLNGSYAGTYP
jgi:hypothetical protein